MHRRPRTEASLESRPRPRRFSRIARQRGYSFSWEANENGGAAVDRNEWQVTYNGGLTWTDWATLAANALSHNVGLSGGIPDKVRVRASNQNARAASILGLTDSSVNQVVPFVRPVSQSLTIRVNINSGATLTGKDLDTIRTQLIRQIEAYEIGQEIWVPDLEAVIERLPNVRLDSLTVQHNGVDISGVVQKAFNQWRLAANDITISFS